ncbi:hypothetical protein [Flavobacterium sp. XS2P14]|uniref:hypothetical protein n=1 Tax=Flavobacterium sp. XS2P14 TaxID=3401735 RepID=UPI003AAA20B1
MEMKLTLLAYYSMGMLFGFLIGYGLGGIKKEKKEKNSNIDKLDAKRLHCFDCEIEMPVKVKNGRAFCSNCGLPH